jgi:hypothetical protein
MSKLALHFKRPKNWGSSVRLHYWATQPQVPATNWPGVPMRAIGDDWFSYEIQGAAAASVVFTDGEGQQTADLSRDQEGWYTLSEGWSAADPDVVAPPPADVKTRARGGHVSSG